MNAQNEGAQKTPSITEMLDRGNKIYARIQNESNIETTHEGQYIAIDVNSEKYYIAETREAAVQKGETELPKVVFFVRRIGELDVVAGQYPYFRRSRMSNARFL